METKVLRLAVYQPAPAGDVVPALVRQFGAGVRARIVHRPQEVRTTDDLVVVVTGADGFVRSLARSFGALAPPVLVVVRRGDLATARHPAGSPAERLTPRERDIMALLAAGCSIREIADNLAIGAKTVRNYLSNIYRKLGARRQAEALVRWLSSAETQATG